MKICLVGAELFHAEGQTDGRTDMTQLIVVFRSFAKAPVKDGLRLHSMRCRGCVYKHRDCFVLSDIWISRSAALTEGSHRSFATTVSQLKTCDFSGEKFKDFEVL